MDLNPSESASTETTSEDKIWDETPRVKHTLPRTKLYIHKRVRKGNSKTATKTCMMPMNLNLRGSDNPSLRAVAGWVRSKTSWFRSKTSSSGRKPAGSGRKPAGSGRKENLVRLNEFRSKTGLVQVENQLVQVENRIGSGWKRIWWCSWWVSFLWKNCLFICQYILNTQSFVTVLLFVSEYARIIFFLKFLLIFKIDVAGFICRCLDFDSPCTYLISTY